MKIKCDTTSMLNIADNLEIEVEKYNEIMKKFYNLANSLQITSTWTGTSSKNYSKYLLNKKNKYDTLYLNLKSFHQTLKTNIAEIEDTVQKSKVDVYD